MGTASAKSKAKSKGRPENEAHKAAAARGAKYFYTGVPCIHGHDSPRYTSSWACVKCAILRGGGDISFLDKARSAVRRFESRVENLAKAVATRRALEERDIISDWRKTHELVTWGGPYPTLMSGKWK